MRARVLAMIGLRFHAGLIQAVLLATTVTACTTVDDGNRNGLCKVTGSQATDVIRIDASDGKDSATIQEAIDAASARGGGVIQLSAGQFDIHHGLVLRSNVALRGSGKATVLKASGSFLHSTGPHGGYPLITTNGAENVTIAGLTADQSGDVLDGNIAGRLNEYLVDVRHSKNAMVDGVVTRNPFTYSIAVVGSSGFCVRNNSTLVQSSHKYDQLDGIHVTDSHSGVVEGNQIDQRQGADGDDGLVAQTIGASVHDVVYRDNDVRGGSHGAGMQLAVSGHEIYNVSIEHNRFWGSPTGITTGYYDGEDQSVHDVTVRGNSFLDLDGASIDFHGDLANIHVVENRACRSGAFNVADGSNNVVEHNVTSCDP